MAVVEDEIAQEIVDTSPMLKKKELVMAQELDEVEAEILKQRKESENFAAIVEDDKEARRSLEDAILRVDEPDVVEPVVVKKEDEVFGHDALND